MSDPIISVDLIKRQARDAAETGAGPQANPYPEGGGAFYVFLDHYYAALNELALEELS